ncbi:nitroreductase [Sphingomonas sp. Root50]|uniref:nitroreductase n=2 Tax=Sphingomonas TaxID=13687 RepID=UPI000A54B526|nr:nitroreductase [Sphingomonas sp. Root50]
MPSIAPQPIAQAGHMPRLSVTEAVLARRSVRAFRPDPLPADTIREILELAARSPSGGNLQPWRLYALAGAEMARLKSLGVDRMLGEGAEPEEYRMWPPEELTKYRQRVFSCGELIYGSVGIAREDVEGRRRMWAGNMNLFGAPVGIFLCLHRDMGYPQWADAGMYLQTLMLLAQERGIDSCAMEAWAVIPDTVRSVIGYPDDYILFSGLALGYKQEGHPLATLHMPRVPFDDYCDMRGF